MTPILLFGLILFSMAIIMRYLEYIHKVLYQKKYSSHLTFEHPLYTQDQATLKKHMYIALVVDFITIMFLSTFFYYFNLDTGSFNLFQFIFGAVGIIYAISISHSLSGIWTFMYVNKHPHSITGQTFFKKPLVVRLSQSILINCLVPLLFLVIMQPTELILGALVTLCVLIIIRFTQPIY